MLRVEEFRTIEELRSLEARWQELWGESPSPSFFQSFDWLELYWRHFSDGQQLRVFAVEADSRIIGIVPLVLRNEWTRAGNIRVLTYPLQDWGSFYAPIGSNPSNCLAAALKHLHRQPRDWDLLDLRWFDKSLESVHDPAAAMHEAGFSSVERLWRETAVVDFHTTWKEYLATRSSKFRNNLRRAEMAARRAGTVTFERYRPSEGSSEPDWQLYDECLASAERSWQASSSTGTTITHAPVRKFFRELFGLATRKGAIDLNVLRLDGQVVAFTYNLVHRRQIYGLRIGFESDRADISPGKILIARSLEDSFARGDRMLDMGSESIGFKRHWMTRTLGIFQHTHYSSASVKSQLLRAKHWLWDRNVELSEVAT